MIVHSPVLPAYEPFVPYPVAVIALEEHPSLRMVGNLVAHEGDPIVKKPLSEISFPTGAVVGAVIRGNKFLIPRGDTRVADGDRVVVFALPNAVEDVEKLFS